MQKNLQVVETVKPAITVPAPVELTAEQLQQVGGGVTGPNGTWSDATAGGPNGTW
jgi:hypothetical protein